MTSIRDVFMSMSAPPPSSPLLAKYYPSIFAQPAGYNAQPFGWTGSMDPTRAPYQFNFERFGDTLSPLRSVVPSPKDDTGILTRVARINEPEDEGGGDVGGDAAGKETPMDVETLGDYSNVGFGDIASAGAKAAAAIGGAALGMPGVGMLAGAAIDRAFAPDPYSAAIPEEVVGIGIGPQTDLSALGGLGISSVNLDQVGFPDLETPDTNLEDMGWGFGDVDVSAPDPNEMATAFNDPSETLGFGDIDQNEIDEIDPDTEAIGEVGDDEAASSSGGGGTGGSSGGDPGDEESDEDDWFMGGLVTRERLSGPDPAGPDDGRGYLDVGEYVIRKDAVKKYGSRFFDRLNKKKIKKGMLAGVL